MKLKDIEKRLRELSGTRCEAGWLTSTLYPSGVPVAQVAAINEFGMGVPSRPFMSYAANKFAKVAPALAAKAIDRVVKGESVERACAPVAIQAQNEVIMSIKTGPWKPNAPATVERKGFDKPLIDTSLMFQSVTFQVTK